MRTIIILFYIILSAGKIIAQNRIQVTISGQIKDIQNEAVQGATVKLLMAGDSTAVAGVTSRNNGGFELRVVSPGVYLLAVSQVGMEPYFSNTVTINGSHPKLQLPAIILLPAKRTALKEVVVTAKKPMLEYDLDRTIVNVESMLGAASGNTLEVLEKTPGVMVDNNGDISLNGSSGVTVLIDGRPTYMSGRDLAAYLRSLPGSMLDKIELITNPPAKYDANGGAVINIKLKKKRTQGYAGSASHNSNLGKRYRSYNSINLNYLNRNTNLFGNFGYSRYTDITDTHNERAFFSGTGQKTASSIVENRNESGSHEFSARIGMDHNLNKKTTIGMILNVSTRKREEGSEYVSKIFSTAPAPDSTGIGTNTTNGRWQQFGGNINFQHRFTERGEEMTADINYIRYNNRNHQWLENLVIDPSQQVKSQQNFIYALPYSTDVLTGRIDYSLPLKDRSSFSAGLRSSMVKTDQPSDYFSILDDKPFPDYGRSNHFIYHEDIHAAYMNGRKDWKRFGLQLGLRWEYTATKGDQLGNQQVGASAFTRDYHSFFPSIAASYKLDSAGQQVIGLSYSRRINRPNYQQLNPFMFFVDQYSYSIGNPLLLPAFSNRYEINWRYKQLLTVRVGLDHQTDGIASATRMENKIQISSMENFAIRDGIMAMAMLNLKPAKWWNLSHNIAVGRFVTKGKFNGQELDLKNYSWRTQIQNQFRISDSWSAELFGTYQAPWLDYQRFVHARHWVNAALQKKVLKNKGSIKLNLEDIFRGMGSAEESRGIMNAYSYRKSIPDTRRVAISFNYNFGKETFSRKRKYNDNAADELKERAQ